MRDEYWTERRNLTYYQEVRRLLEELGPMHSILDIGSGGTPVATWGDFSNRYAVDQDPCQSWPGVSFYQCEWVKFDCPNVDVITCLQVMEHLEDYQQVLDFSNKIAEHCRIAIISVPYEWPQGVCQYHPMDPIDFMDLQYFSTGDWLSYKLCTDEGMGRSVLMTKGNLYD